MLLHPVGRKTVGIHTTSPMNHKLRVVSRNILGIKSKIIWPDWHVNIGVPMKSPEVIESHQAVGS